LRVRASTNLAIRQLSVGFAGFLESDLQCELFFFYELEKKKTEGTDERA
jgi:hypothetical protein